MSRKPTTTAKGLGWDHQVQRDYLIARHVEGTPCWWCGKPMFRTQELAADHSHTRATGGTKADRLLHALCNKRRGDGSRDHLRPAVTGKDDYEDERDKWTVMPW